MRRAFACCIVLLTLVAAAPSQAGNKITLHKGTPSGSTGAFTHHGGVVELNASDCRLDGGEVITPADARCGKLGAAYCRKKNGEAACLTEQ